MTRAFRVLLVLTAAAVVFVVQSSQGLPAVVASHFVAGGTPDAFMSRAGYTVFMALLTLGLPLLFPLVLQLASRLPPSMLNLPHRDYWLAPERKAATFQYLVGHGTVFGGLLLVFVCLVHWQVVQANAAQPPRLAEAPFLVALAAFILCTLAWLGVFFLHFRRRPAPG